MREILFNSLEGQDPVQIRLSGAGGQGLITAGIILAEAALLEGKNVVQTQSYGPEARLGASKAEVIISQKKIAYPQVTKPDWLLCLSEDAFKKFSSQITPETIIVLDSTNVESEAPQTQRCYKLPISEAAAKAGSKVVANVVSLGAMNVLAHWVQMENLRKAVAKRVPERFRPLNLKALDLGAELAKSISFQSVET